MLLVRVAMVLEATVDIVTMARKYGTQAPRLYVRGFIADMQPWLLKG